MGDVAGMPTDTIVGPALAERLRHFAAGRPNPVDGAVLIASEALRCSRRIAFRVAKVPMDIPWSDDEKSRFADGDFVDSIVAETFAMIYGGRMQVPFHWLPQHRLHGKADVGYRLNGTKTVVEAKSASTKAFNRQVGAWSSVPPGPKPEWVVQAGLAALSPMIGAPQVHIVLVDNERYETAEWLIGVDDPLVGPDFPVEIDEETGEMREPTIRDLVGGELQRQSQVADAVEAGGLPARVVPGFGLVHQPPARDEMGEPWACRYCPWQPTCSRLPAEAVADFEAVAA